MELTRDAPAERRGRGTVRLEGLACQSYQAGAAGTFDAG